MREVRLLELDNFLVGKFDKFYENKGRSVILLQHPGVRSETPPEGYSVFLSYESSMSKTAVEHPRVPFPNASQTKSNWFR